jgi:hypothetical protein
MWKGKIKLKKLRVKSKAGDVWMNCVTVKFLEEESINNLISKEIRKIIRSLTGSS